MMVRFIRFLASSLLLLIALAMTVVTPVILAQANCPTIIQDAITVLGNSCDGVVRNNACYGNVDVEAQFNLGYEEPFDRAGDLAQLVNMQRLTTSPVNTVEEEWGIALLSLQANIPDTIPGQSVIFMLMGDAEVENSVEPDGTLSGERIPVTTRRSGSLRAEPSASSRILTFIPGSTELGALGISEDGEWLRVNYNGQSGWIIARMVRTIPEFDTPTDAELYTPMQSFYLRTGIGRPDCVQAPNTLMVQGPKDFSIDLTVNGAEIRIGSTIFLRNIAPDVMQLIVAEGQVTLYPDTPNARIVPTGGFSTICLEAPQDLGVDGEQNDRTVRDSCVWTPAQLFTDWDEFEILDDLPPDLLIYDFTFPDEPIIVEDCEINPDWTSEYTVITGDTLSLIAPRYNLSAEELGFGNCLADYDLIIPNQVLKVPVIEVVYNPPPFMNTPVPTNTPVPMFVDLAVTLTASNATPSENDLFSYMTTITNLGTQNATNVVVAIPCPVAYTEYFSDTGGGAYNNATGVWTVGTIPAGTSVTLQIDVYARPGEAIAGAFNSVASILTVTEPDTNSGNNTSAVSVDIVYYIDGIHVTDGSLVIANDGLCTLTEAINNANGNNFSHPVPMAIGECATGNGSITFDTIKLFTNVTTNASVTYVADGTNAFPPITDNLAIDGMSHSITLVAGSARLFNVQAGSQLGLKFVTVTGGNPPAGEEGGAIFNNGTVYVSDMSSVTGNQVSGLGGGGGIFNNGGTVVVNLGGAVSGNTVNGVTMGGGIKSVGGTINIDGGYMSNNQVLGGFGGAIYATGGTSVLMSNWTTMQNNQALSGGAVYLTSGATLNVTGFVFHANGASNEAGAIYMGVGTGPHNINATFDQNTATSFGGAVYVGSGVTVTFNTATFTTNSANQGGAIYSYVGFTTLNNSSFTGNTAGVGNASIVENAFTAITTFNTTNIDAGQAAPLCVGSGFGGSGNTGAGAGVCYP